MDTYNTEDQGITYNEVLKQYQNLCAKDCNMHSVPIILAYNIGNKLGLEDTTITEDLINKTPLNFYEENKISPNKLGEKIQYLFKPTEKQKAIKTTRENLNYMLTSLKDNDDIFGEIYIAKERTPILELDEIKSEVENRIKEMYTLNEINNNSYNQLVERTNQQFNEYQSRFVNLE